MARAVSDWLSGYLKYTEGSEPPQAYHIWTALSIIAGALQRRVWLKWGFETIYPNLYVILVGPSGGARKGVALGIGKELLSNADGIILASESITREALIRSMKSNIMNYRDDTTGEIKFHCSLTCFSEELSVFLGQNDIKFLASLTDWYDSKDKWTYETKGAGTDQLQGICFNLLGATAPDWLQSMLPQEAVGGGFTSRCIFVVEERKSKTVAKHTFSKEEVRIKEGLIRDLERIAQITGEFKFAPDGEEAYIKWYTEQDALLAKGQLPVADERFSGYCERRSTHIRKLCMLLSISRGDDRTIRLIDFERALGILKSTELKMYKTFGGLGTAQYSQITERVIEYIKRNGVTTRSSLMQKFRRDLDPGALKIIEEVMRYMRTFEIITDLRGGDVVYKWKGDENGNI